MTTPVLLDEYLRVSFDALHVVDEMKWKDDKEKQAVKQEFEVFFEDYRALREDACLFLSEPPKETFCEERKLFEELDQIRRTALSDCKKLFAEHKKEIYDCIRICMHLQQTAFYRGLKALILEGQKLNKSDKIYCKLLAYGIGIIQKSCSQQIMDQFGRKAAEDTYLGYLLYVCTRFLGMLCSGEHTPSVQTFLLSCVPGKEHNTLLEYLKDLEYETI